MRWQYLPPSAFQSRDWPEVSPLQTETNEVTEESVSWLFRVRTTFELGCAEFSQENIDECPTYWFFILDPNPVGTISLRMCEVGSEVEFYAGHIGYRVEKEFRGHRYAARAVMLLLSFAKEKGLCNVWITADPTNIASVRTCEIAGGELVETVSVPPTHYMFKRGEEKKNRYLWRL
tara:strand:+ start:991 stop:1518 length:528 start_codon:yes stop_codon:yes gene_type:complete